MKSRDTPDWFFFHHTPTTPSNSSADVESYFIQGEEFAIISAESYKTNRHFEHPGFA